LERGPGWVSRYSAVSGTVPGNAGGTEEEGTFGGTTGSNHSNLSLIMRKN